MVEQMGSKDFAEHLNTVFRVEEPLALPLELSAVDEGSNAQVEQFSLTFTGPESPWLRQGTYALKHETAGEIELFLVPLGPRDGRMIYESVFARLKNAVPAPKA